MDDWITHHFLAFWISLVAFGMIVGVWFLSDAYGMFGGLAAGAIGGGGAALILSINRYIGGSDGERDGPPT